ncbi:MAG: T9SS type A sorting domain-containing protein [Bacteroidia bacterium]|nr:T9SS type A sorting domain-containing protein [Bacteroidia bacterium]
MRTITTFKTAAIALASAAVITLPILNVSKKYVPRQDVNLAMSQNFSGAAEYYHWLKMDPATGKLNYAAMMSFQSRKAFEYMNAAQMKTNVVPVMDLAWEEMGPDNVGGRCRAVLIDKFNTNRLFAGGVSGGLFMSTNSGTNWAPINDQLATLVVSCITQDGDGTIYFGTGEGMARGGSGDGNSAFPGLGMYYMTYNAGTDSYSAPALLPYFTPTVITALGNSASFSTWSFINDVKVSPVKVGGFYIIYAATYRGLQVSSDGGATWTTAIAALATTFCEDIDVANDGTVYAALGGGNNGTNKIFYSPAGNNGLPGTYVNITPASTVAYPWASFGRIELAVSATNSNIVYASIAKPLTIGATLLVVYQSINSGTSWTSIGTGSANFLPFATYGQGDYDHILEIVPGNDYSIFLGGVDMFRWDAVNPTIAPYIGQWTSSPSVFSYLHADNHAITFHPTNPNIFYVGNDGGVFRTINGGSDFTACNTGFNVTQFYACSFERDALSTFGANIGQYNSAGVFGGSQDNGTLYISGNNNTVKSSQPIGGGDGFYTEASMLSPNVFFTTSYYGFLRRTPSRDFNSSEFYPGRNMIGCTNTAQPGSDYNFASFITPISLWESYNMTNSPDSVDFAVDSIRIPSVTVVGNGYTAHYKFTIPKPQIAAVIDWSSLKITAGTHTVTTTGINGLLESGQPVGTYYSSGDSIDVTFNANLPVNAPIKVVAAISYPLGSSVSVTSNSVANKFAYTLPVSLVTGDTLKVQDIIQSRLAVGLTGCMYLCKNPLNFGAIPNWIKIAGNNSVTSTGTSAAFSGTIQTLEWAGPDILYAANTAGTVFRIMGLASVIDSASSDIDSLNCTRRKTSPITCERIANFSKSVTSISVDPTNPDRIILTVGNYGSLNHVYYCTTGTTCPANTGTANFSVVSTVDNPVYSSTFVQTFTGQTNPNNVLIGTEDGVYSIDLSNQGAGWQSEKANASGMFPNVPTFMLMQQTWGNGECHNSGIIYAATHGRGFWQSKKYFSPLQVGVPEIPAGNKGANKLVKVFPNPANNFTNVNFTLSEDKKISINVYDLKGSKVKTISFGKLNKGTQNLQIELDGISEGTYIVSVASESEVLGTCRFVKIAD